MHDSPRSERPAKASGSPPTIYDVARLSGVSPSTVSRALNKPGRLAAKTEQRIREVAEAIDYRLNPMARALPTGRTRTIALIISDFTNPVYFDLVRGAERVAAASGYVLILAESQESAELEDEAAQRLTSSVDGLILVSTRLQNRDIRSLSDRKSLVVVNRNLQGVPSLVPDVRPGIGAALDLLREHGHRSALFVPGPSNSWMSGIREKTVLKEAAARDLQIDVWKPTPPTLVGGRDAAASIAASGATAVLAYNDLIAIGLMQGCGAAGVAVPDELSIIGFDDIFGSDFTSPALTTIRTPLYQLGEQAVRRLISDLDGDGGVAREKLVTELVTRGSVGSSPRS